MLQVRNETPFAARLFVFPDATGIDTLFVVVKATFDIGPKQLGVSPEQAPIVPVDEHFGDPARSSVKYGGEAHPSKPATDVVLVGSGHAPGGRPVPYFGVSLKVGALEKLVHVYGDRRWKSGALGSSPSNPVPTVEVPLVYERAYGGRHELGEGRFLAEPRNPVGVGFAGRRSGSEMNGTPVPNLDDPRRPILSLADHPAPACFGCIPPSWQPRVSFGGTYDESWRKRRAPFFPDDFDPRYFQAAPPDQIYPGRLKGGEPVRIINASPVGVQEFALPTCELSAVVSIAGRLERPALGLETLLLEPDQGRFSLLWRGAVPCDKQALKVDQVAVSVKSLQGVAP